MKIGPTINLRRDAMGPNGPTFGELTVVQFGLAKILFRCWTLEPPWLGNKRRVSCIPVGVYTARFLPTDKFPNLHKVEPWYKDHLWELTDVPGRDETKFHHGNTVKDTQGCPLLGMEKTSDGISKSREALCLFHSALEPFESGPVTVNVFEIPRARK